MATWQKVFPLSYRLFMKIAEPRVVRLLHFGIYVCMLTAGFGVLSYPPRSFDSLVGTTLVYIFGAFVFLGGLLGAVSVLPGVWWLERVGILALITGMLMYIAMIIELGSSPIGFVIPIAFSFTFALRWLEIRRYQLAPREE